MVSVRADAITLSIDNLFSMKLDSSLLLTNKSHKISLAVARLDEDAFFLTVNLKYSAADNTVRWEINPIVKPLISQIIIRPENEETPQSYGQNSVLATTEGEPNQPYPIVLTPGQSQHITDDIVVHLLSQSRWHDNEGDENAWSDSRDWVFADRYHVLSSWPAGCGMGNGVREDGDVSRTSSHGDLTRKAERVSRTSSHGDLPRKAERVSRTSSHGDLPRKAERVSCENKPVNFSDASPRCATRRECVECEALSNSPESDLDDDGRDIDAVVPDLGQSNWLGDLRDLMWDVLAMTTSALLDSFPSVSKGID